jgi:copper(I)-binding protein
MQRSSIPRPSCRRVRVLVWAFALANVLCPAAPAAAAVADLFVVNEPWVRPAASGSTEAYMNLRSSTGATLVGVRSEHAARVSMVVPDPARHGRFHGVTRMALPAGETVRLAPGQVHLRLSGIAHALKLREHVALVLTLEAPDGSTREIAVDAEVRRRSPTDDEAHAHGHPAAAR